MRIGPLLVALALAAPAAAQQAPAAQPPAAGAAPPAVVQSPVLTIDPDRLLAETLFGRRIAADLSARADALEAENETLRLALVEEEASLAERRPGMEIEDFRAEADAFDQRVQRIRAEQDAKQQALETAVESERQRFLGAVTPVLGRLMVESGAAVILDRRQVFLGATLVDVTDEAVAAIDAQLGDGTPPEPAPPADAPDPGPAVPPSPGAAGSATPAPAGIPGAD